MTQRRTDDRVRVVERNKERGSVLILTALVMPVLVLFAGLGIGGAVVRSSADETQRTASLTAAAAAAQVPTLGRPTYSGLPSVPSNYQVPLPPGVPYADGTTFSPNSVYQTELGMATVIDDHIAVQSGVGPLFTSALGAVGSPWERGCRVGEAQYANARARMSTNFARSPGRTPKCPVVSGGTVSYPGNAEERIYVRPEMESTGAYRLQLCFVNPANCALFFGQGPEGVLREMGETFGENMPDLEPLCILRPTAPGCLLADTTLESAFNMGAAQADAVQATVDTQVTNAGATVPPPLQDDYMLLAGLLFGRANLTDACNIDLGRAAGQTLCTAGVNLASLLPSTMTPRVRTVVRHSVDIPLVPDWANGSDPGDFDFTGHALARRTFKNAVVVPALHGSFGATQEVCLRGATALNALPSSTPVPLSTLSSLVNGLSLSASAAECSNVEADYAPTVEDPANPGQQLFPIDLNDEVLAQQGPLLDMAARENERANRAVNGRIASALNAEDGGNRKASDCSSDRSSNPGGPAPWCVDIGGQMIRDVKDVYDPPGGGSAPSAQEVMKGAAESGEPVEVLGLMKQVPVVLDPPIRMPNGTVVNKLTYWIPALDFVPTIVECFFDPEAKVYIRPKGSAAGADLPCDAERPFSSTFRIIEDASGPKGLYRAVLMHPNASDPLCTYPLDTGDAGGRCIDQPKDTVTVPPVVDPVDDPVVVTTTVPIPVTLPTTTVPLPTLPPTTLPPTIPPTTIQILPLPTAPPTIPKIGLP